MEIILVEATTHQVSTQLVNKIVAALKNGGLVIMPTETVYGAMVDVTNPAAVEKLLKYKARRRGRPLSIAVNSQEMASQFAVLNEQAQNLYREFLPGPVTVVSTVAVNSPLATSVASEFNTIGIRWPDHPLVLAVIKKLGRPVSATSANQSGRKTPYAIDDILSNLSQSQKNLLDLIIDVGQLAKRPPSIVIDTTLSTPLVMRGTMGQGPLGTFRDQKSLKVPKGPALLHFLSQNVQETHALAGKFLLKYQKKLLERGLVITLDGELGAGKTTFTQGLAKFLNLEEIISSPTYTYQKEYDFDKKGWRGTLYHFDAWAIENQTTFNLLNIADLIQPGKLIVIEWWEQIKTWANFEPDLEIKISASKKELEREIEVLEKNDD